MDVVIRRAQMGDAGAVAVILRELGWWEEMLAEPLDKTMERVMGLIRQCNADRSHSLYVAEWRGEVVGYGSVHWIPCLFLRGPEGYLSELFVREKGRGQGIGKGLLAVIKKEALERNCARLMLVNGRKRKSYKRKFYQRQGWEERKKVANFILPLG